MACGVKGKALTGNARDSLNSIAFRKPRSRIGVGFLGSVRGLALLGVALAEAGLILALASEVNLWAFVYPGLLIPPTLLAVRRLANRTRPPPRHGCGVPPTPPARRSPPPPPP